jgi:hypothetical protein
LHCLQHCLRIFFGFPLRLPLEYEKSWGQAWHSGGLSKVIANATTAFEDMCILLLTTQFAFLLYQIPVSSRNSGLHDIHYSSDKSDLTPAGSRSSLTYLMFYLARKTRLAELTLYSNKGQLSPKSTSHH